jgi:hypothetical protein
MSVSLVDYGVSSRAGACDGAYQCNDVYNQVRITNSRSLFGARLNNTITCRALLMSSIGLLRRAGWESYKIPTIRTRTLALTLLAYALHYATRQSRL